jgi:predicted CopG family antitoxin
MSENVNPFTGTGYSSWDDVEKDLKDHPWCRRKIMAIWHRIQKLLNREEMRDLCNLWGCVTAEETYNKIMHLTDKELSEEVDKIIKRRKKKQEILEAYQSQYQQQQVPSYIA